MAIVGSPYCLKTGIAGTSQNHSLNRWETYNKGKKKIKNGIELNSRSNCCKIRR
jgi:hypothetical protein